MDFLVTNGISHRDSRKQGVKLLVKTGHDTAFGVTGGGAMFLNEAFRKEKKLNFIFTHHEQSAAMAAESYYRIKKKASIF